MITVIVPTRDRADLLHCALHSLTKQTLAMEKFEVLVIDNGSTDRTSEVITRFSGKLPNLKTLYVSEPGLHAGRHAGMKASKGNVLVFADDDIEALPTWLNSLNEAFSDTSVAMAGGNNLPMFMETPPAWLLKMWKRAGFRGYRSIPSLSVIQFTREPREISPYLVWGCNFAIRKPVLLEAGGFHPDSMPKDLIRFRGDGETHVSRYVAKSSHKCIFHPGASVHHKVTPERMTKSYFRQRGFNQGVSDSYTQLRHQGTPGKRTVFQRIMRKGLHALTSGCDDKEVRLVLDQLAIGYAEGYKFHQATYQQDPEVRAWVHKPLYY